MVKYAVTNTYQTLNESEKDKARETASKEVYRELVKYLEERKADKSA